MAYSAKRSFPRSQFSEALRIVSSRGIEYATAQDLGAGGLQLLSDADFPIGMSLLICFTLRRGAEMSQKQERQAVVTYCRRVAQGYQVGVQFLRPHSDSAAFSQELGPF